LHFADIAFLKMNSWSDIEDTG